MSSRPCNFCLVEDLRERCKRDGSKVVLVDSPLGRSMPDGKDVFVVPKGQELDASVDEKSNHGPQWRMWAAAISKTCAC
jgi:hypothetical protein